MGVSAFHSLGEGLRWEWFKRALVTSGLFEIVNTDTDLDQSHALSRIFRTLGVKLLP